MSDPQFWDSARNPAIPTPCNLDCEAQARAAFSGACLKTSFNVTLAISPHGDT